MIFTFFLLAQSVAAPAAPAAQHIHRDVACSEKPFYVTSDVAEGNYDVTVTFGDRLRASSNTVKAEGRRLMVEKLDTAAGKTEKRTFTVNVRYSAIALGSDVKLKPREIGSPRWDKQLTLEFNGSAPCVSDIDIAPTHAITLYLAGDSTVVDQDKEPWAAWGQMLPRFFKPGVAIANHAESGETLRAFVGERRLEKVMSQIQAGDYLFVQFAHNDQKQGSSYAEPFGSYKERLKDFITQARSKGAQPVLVTSMNRRTFDAAGKIENSLGDYPAAMRQVAQEENVPLIDLNAMSKTLFEAMGPEATLHAFVHEGDIKDDTHFVAYGAYELARCVVEGIKANKLGIAKYLTDDAGTFDPAHPDPWQTWKLPRSPAVDLVAPEGH